MTSPTRNSAVGVGVAIGVALAVALDNILLGVGVACAAALWTASNGRDQVPVDSQEQKTGGSGGIE